ncbi:MAG: BatA domain-containing protein [Chthoniobacter sp.]|nr:BatA domain-containing protein [Chthoniobacter sp.]
MFSPFFLPLLMAYLQPWMLWVLPAVLLPIIIHLLNRLRYKTVHWAAMIFLLKANRAATRRAKIRQYILLALRCLVLLFLIWAMARPLIGGWLGSAAGGAPEAIVLLLDRSASMEGRGGEGQESKRAHALALLSQAAKQSVGSHFVLIENVLRQPLEIADASTLATMQMCEATDTGADLPAMFRAALDYLAKNKPGSAEVWVASDLQASNWRPESPEWQDIAARFNGLTQGVRVRILDLSSAPGNNVSLSLKSAEMRVRDEKTGKAQLSLALELKTDAPGKGTLPLLFTRDGAKSQVDVPLKAATQRQNLKFDLPKAEPGWGELELPADENPGDNTAYFAYAPPVPMRAVIVAEGASAQRLRLAAAPDKSRTDRTAEILPIAQTGKISWKDTALIVWAAPPPDETVAKSLQGWVEGGGVLLCLPPGGAETSGPLGLTWAAAETAPKPAPFRVTAWDDLDGPLARTDNGTPLGLAKLEIARRQIPSGGETNHTAAAFADGHPFLLSRKAGAGLVFACATLPDADWGNFGDGFVLLPMTQRLLAMGGKHLAPPTMAIAGEWQPADPQETWIAVETDRRRDWRWHAGVYRNGAQLIALNRPESEDAPEIVERARLPELLRGVKLTVMAGALELKADRLQSEIWPAMIVLTMLFMCAEMALATSKAMLPIKPGAKSASSRPPSKPATAEVSA